MADENNNGWKSPQNVLMVILIVVTTVFGYTNYREQQKNNDLQKKIYTPKFVPVAHDQPRKINEPMNISVGIFNAGYISGAYGITLKSDNFTFATERFGSGKEIKIDHYVLQNGKEDDISVTIEPPSNPKPITANYQITYTGDDGFDTTREYCYQLAQDSTYISVACQDKNHS